MLLQTSDLVDSRSGLSSLYVVNLSSNATVLALSRADVQTCTWAGDDTLAYTDQTAGLTHLIPLSAQAEAILAQPSGAGARLPLRVGGTSARTGVVVKRRNALGVEEALHPRLQCAAAPGSQGFFLRRASFETQLGSLGQVVKAQGGVESIIVDRAGATVLNFETAFGVYATTTTSDGRFVIGQREVDSGETVSACSLFVIDLATNTLQPIEGPPNAIDARMSPGGYLVCFSDPITGETHVGSLVISAR